MGRSVIGLRLLRLLRLLRFAPTAKAGRDQASFESMAMAHVHMVRPVRHSCIHRVRAMPYHQLIELIPAVYTLYTLYTLS